MNIAIIGAGNVGSALAGAAVRAGHEVTVTAASAEHARSAAQQTGARYADSNTSAADSAEVIILAVPYDAVSGILAQLGDVAAGKVLIDVTNRFNPSDPGAVVDGSSNAETIQAQARTVRVVKAFNTVFAALQANPVVDGIPLDGFVAGDDTDAKEKVLELVHTLGFRPIDVGPLSMSRALEAMGWLNIYLNMQHGWSWQDGWKLIGPTK